ncbi:uncharacterized protein BXZ73DRAFT_49175, partial [Epithele typhae]|uniref:uncharacterized protein n=1 Tax=Epithele typhae TaxID=378194 RepID=UPI002008906E
LREDLDLQRSHRQEFSEEILNDAKQRLEQLQYHQLGHTTDIQDSEVTKVLESLVADNEVLKRDNAELQNLLAQEREEIHTLQEELEERRAGDTLSARGHRFTQSGASYTFHDTSGPLSPTFHLGTAPSGSILRSRLQREMGANNRRSISNERVEKGSREGYKPLTPETERRPLSPAESHIASGSKWTSFTRPMTPRSALHTPSHSTFSRDVDEDGSMLSPERPRATKPLLLLTRERGVQTDGPWSGGNSSMSPSPIPRNYGDQVSSHEGHSEASSLTDNIQTTAIGTLVDRTNQLLNRLTQSDALTLTNRLKRQHLLGADVSHLSRTTVNSIVNDVTALRSHFRVYLEDEKTTTTCTRRDLRSLLKLLKDVFTELGQMRVTLNDVILDPTVAGRVSEMAMNPSKVQSAEAAAGSSGGSGGASGWIAPISKLLGLPGGSSNQDSATSGAFSSARNLGRGRPPPRVVPKLQPALSASAMTVNVEFTGAGVGRSVTSTHSAHPSRMTFGLPGIGGAPPTTDSAGRVPPNSAPIAQPAPRQDVSRLMGIFAGAPKPAERDPWIVIPRPPSNTGGAKISRSASVAGLRSSVGTVGRATLRPPGVVGRRLSRIVDAIIDVQSPQLDHNDDGEGGDTVGEGAGPPPALERALRRGLSDSSIRTTFTQHGGTEDQEQPSEAGPSQPADREGVLQALSRRMQAFRFATGTPSPAEVEGLPVEGGRPRTPVAKSNASTGSGNAASKPSPPRAIPQTRKRGESASGNAGASASTSLFGLASWAAPYDEMEEAERPRVSGPYFAGSPREDAFAQRNWTRDRDF